MRACRFLTALIISMALDLAVPVAPTPAGVEFEDDEEVVHFGSARVRKPAPEPAQKPPMFRDAERVRASVAVSRARAREAWHDAVLLVQTARSSPSDTSNSSARSVEDH